MSTSTTETPATTIIEPSFQMTAPGVIEAAVKSEQNVNRLQAFAKSSETGGAEFLSLALAAPTTRHQPELLEEILYDYQKGYRLLYDLHLADFKSNILSATLKGMGPVWEVGEVADYEVTFKNNTYSDLKNMKVKLNILTPPGTANSGGVEIINPPGNSLSLGDVGYGLSKTVTFKLRAKKGGDVILALGISGLIGTFKPELSYQGYFWNGTSWGYNSNWQKQFHIYG